jgi:hypothetical protein
MDNSVAIQLQAMQLNYARDAIAQTQAAQPPVIPQPGQTAPAPVPADAILELSAAAQQLLS